MKDLISVIVTIYNSEKWLEKCVNSISNQTYQNLEIILVNDGSKDNSLEMCKELQAKDSRIKIYSHENHGCSYSMNVGISVATGKYFAIVDSDDWIDVTMYEKLYQKITEENADLCYCKMAEVEGEKVTLKKEKKLFEMLKNSDIKYLYASVESGENVHGSNCRTLFKKEAIKIKFNDEISLQQDLIFMEQLIANKALKKVMVDENLYFYQDFVTTNVKKYVTDKTFYEAEKLVLIKKDFLIPLGEIELAQKLMFSTYVGAVSNSLDQKEKLKYIFQSKSYQEFSSKENYLVAQRNETSFQWKITNFFCYKKWILALKIIRFLHRLIK